MKAKKKEDSKVKFDSAIFFVKDLAKSKQFYADLLSQKIVWDFGKNITFEGGFAIWKREDALDIIFSESAPKERRGKNGTNNTEVYFESANLEELYEKLKENGIKFVHPIREERWGQRSFRAYDPDGYIIRFGEPMSSVVARHHQKGMSPEDIAKKVVIPLEVVNKILEII